jgi:hypothetical protein
MPKKIEPSVANETQLNATRIVAAVLLGVILGARVSGRRTGLEFVASCGQLPDEVRERRS